MSGTSSERARKPKESSLAPATPSAPQPDYPGASPPTSGPAWAEARAHETYMALGDLFVRGDGWLRAVSDGDCQKLHLKWKFTGGIWAGYYGYVAGNWYEYPRLLSALCEQLDEIDGGRRQPTRDKFFDQM